jgi:hypothetical protein
MFELVYEPFEAGSLKVAEVKRISLDAGQNLDQFRSYYKLQSGSGPLVTAIGLKKVAGERKELNAERGWLAKWEAMDKRVGNQGLAVVVNPKTYDRQTEDKLNLLVLSKVGADNVASYWAGFCWDKGGQFTDFEGWKAYVDRFAQAAYSPIELVYLR